MTYEEARRRLREEDQEQLLRFWDRLDEAGRKRLLRQVGEIDFESVRGMREVLRAAEGTGGPAPFEPAAAMTLGPDEAAAAHRAGEAELRAGRVGILLVAGGQGTRLGFDGPKGAFPIGPLSGDALFAVHAKKILAFERTYGAPIPWYIMTSQANDGPTRAFFAEHDHFGLDPERVLFFTQGMWPALTPEGRIILDAPDHVFMAPDGHGGLLAALRDRGVLDDMERRGLRTVFYFQVDNPLVEIADPVFLGMHAERGADLSVKVCGKRDPEEGLGIVVQREGRLAIVEYSELTDEQMHARLPSGELKYNTGSVALHVFSYAFLRSEAHASMPLHIAHKKVPYCDEDGNTVKPEIPNAYKFEKFIFDVLPHAGRPLVLRFEREDEFSPVKNAEGNDSPATARRDMMRKARRMLEAAGVAVPADEDGTPVHTIEIDPLFARTAEELKAKLSAGFEVVGDTLLA